MSYRALYRVWRPQRFNELIGQPVITQTLKNAVITGQVSHAYLFAGPRGTGKTSAAKIFAKAVNCPHEKNGEPCNHCKICKAITRGELNDVIEIDAASNNGVDEIRNVRDKAQYAPTQAKYKIYIIDEVHMLSTGAFNALLKTLEEPPSHVIFIMATTEPHKIPATIISRTQRFDFRRIQPEDILQRMEYILKHEDVKYDVRALKVIAKAAEGGMRDALSILDEALSYGRDKITYHNALQVTGSVARQLLYKYLKEIVHHDVKSALVDVRKILAAGKDANQFVEDLINYCQDLLLYQQSPQMVIKTELGLIDPQFKKLAGQIDLNLIYTIIERLNDIEEQMRFTTHPDVYLEVLTVRIAMIEVHHPHINQKLVQLTEQVKRLRNEVQHLKRTKPIATVRVPSSGFRPSSSKFPNRPVNLADVYQILSQATNSDLSRMKKAWQQVVSTLPVREQAVLEVAKLMAASPAGIVISFSFITFYQKVRNNGVLLKKLRMKIDQIIGKSPMIAVIPDSKWPKIVNDYNQYHRQYGGNVNSESDNLDQVAKKQAGQIFGKQIEQVLDLKND